MGTKIDLEQLVIELRNLKPQQKLYRVLKRELKKSHHWKDLSRGKYQKNIKHIS